MRWIGFIIALSTFTAVTAGAFISSTIGYGLPGLLKKPVSVRQSSVGGRRRGIMPFVYFGSGRRHRGGSFGHGK